MGGNLGDGCGKGEVDDVFVPGVGSVLATPSEPRDVAVQAEATEAMKGVSEPSRGLGP